MTTSDFIHDLGVLVLDHRLKRVMERLLRDAETIYEARGLDFKARWVSTYLLLEREGPLPITAIASALHVSHPAVIQIVRGMGDARLVREKRDREDGRRRVIELSRHARRIGDSLKAIWRELARAQTEVFASAGCEVMKVLDEVETSWERQSVSDVVLERLEKRGKS